MTNILKVDPLLLGIGVGELEYHILQPNYYNPRYNIVHNSSLRWDIVGNVVKLLDTGNFGGDLKLYRTEGSKYIRVKNFDDDGFNDLSTQIHCLDTHFAQKQRKIYRNDIVLAKDGEGTISKVGYVYVPFDDSVITSHAIRVRFNPNSVLQQFGFLFFKCKYGQLQIERRVTGSTGQKRLPPDYCLTIKVIIPDIEHIQRPFETLVNLANYLYYLAEALVQWIPEFTMDYLGIEMPEESDELCFTVRPEEIDEDYEYRLSPRMEQGKRTTIQIAEKISRPIYICEEVEIKRKMLNPMKNPTKEYNLLHFSNYDPKTTEVSIFKQLGKDFTQNQVVVPNDTLIVGGKSTNKSKIFSSPNLPDTLVYYLSVVFRPRGNQSYIKALWRTTFIQNQMGYLLAGKSEENMSPFYFSKLIIPKAGSELKDHVGLFFDSTISSIKQLQNMSRLLLDLGTFLLEKLIEADTEDKRNHVISILGNLSNSFHANIFVDDLTSLPDYYTEYTSAEEYQRLISNLPEDLQYESFDDYKAAGKYIAPEKLQILKETIDRFVEIVLPKEETEETRETKLLDLIARILNEHPSDLSSLVKALRKDFSDAIKPYELDLERTVESALGRHTNLFNYDPKFNCWELIDYALIERLNLQGEGKKSFERFQTEYTDNSEAKPPSPKHLVHAVLAYLEEGAFASARAVVPFIDENALEEKDRMLYQSVKWQLSSS